MNRTVKSWQDISKGFWRLARELCRSCAVGVLMDVVRASWKLHTIVLTAQCFRVQAAFLMLPRP